MAKTARWLMAALLACALASATQALAQSGPMAAPTVHIQVHALPPAGVANFDPHKAVDAYLARVSGKDRAHGDAYFEGGYVLSVVDVLYTVVLAGLLLWLGISSRMRNLAVRIAKSRFGRFLVYVELFVAAFLVLTLAEAGLAWTGLNVARYLPINPFVLNALIGVVSVVYAVLSVRARNIIATAASSRFMQAPIYVVQYLVVTTIATLPLTIYEGFTREHAYGLSNQTILQWTGDFGTQFLVSLIGFTVLLTVIYAVMRMAQRTWWIWGTGITLVFLVFFLMVYPVYVAPLFNHYSPLPDSAMKSSILSMARANGIPVDNVYTYDESRQTTRISANVSGFLGTTRISLNDNLLNDCTPSEILAVVGHEMGHYVMNHVGILLILFGFVFFVGFLFVDRAYRGLISLLGRQWDVQTIEDPAGLPLLMALFSVFMLVATPVTNTITRAHEIQADIFGLDAVRQPDAFATVILKLSTYRKLSPSPWEEAVFFDHPSGRTRIWEAMRWKAEHLNDPDIMEGPISPQ